MPHSLLSRGFIPRFRRFRRLYPRLLSKSPAGPNGYMWAAIIDKQCYNRNTVVKTHICNIRVFLFPKFPAFCAIIPLDIPLFPKLRRETPLEKTCALVSGNPPSIPHPVSHPGFPRNYHRLVRWRCKCLVCCISWYRSDTHACQCEYL